MGFFGSNLLETNKDLARLNNIEGFEESYNNSSKGSTTAPSGKALRVSELYDVDPFDVTKEQRHQLYKQEYPYLDPSQIDRIESYSNSQEDFALLLEKFDIIKKSEISRNTKKARDKAIDDDPNLTSEQKEQLKKDTKLAFEAEKQVLSGNKTLEEAEKDLENYIAQEYAKAASFVHQNYLLVNSNEINKKLRNPTNFPKYSRTLVPRIKGSASNPLGLYTGKKEGAMLLNFSTQQLSSLVPYMKFFKVILEGNKRTKIEIPFPTVSLGYSQTGKIFRQSSEDAGRYFKNRDGFGIKSFEWQYNGTTEATKFSDLSANLSIYFQDFAQLTALRESGGRKFTYLDLIIPQEATQITEDQKVNQTDDAFVVAEVGWSVPSGNSLFSTEELRAIKENRISLFLQQKNYELDFDSDTTAAFTLNIEYHSAYELMTENRNINAILPSIYLCEQIKDKQDEIQREKERATVKEDVDNSKELKKLNDEFDKIKEEAVKESYRYIFNELLYGDKIHYLKADLAQILNFQGVDNSIVNKITASNKLSTSQEQNIEKNIQTWQNSAAPENENSEDIYFAYLGDILEIITINSTNPNKLKAIGYESNIAQTLRILTTNVGDSAGEINISDIPIDVRLLANFFFEEIISKKRFTITLSNFIKSLLTKLMENKIEKFSENYTPSKRVYQTTFVDSKNDIVGLQTDAAKLSAAFQDGTNYSYLAIYTVPKDGAEYSLIDPNNYKKSKDFDLSERGIYHFVFGSKDSIVRSSTFKKSDIENLREFRIFETQSPYAILANLFTVDLDMFGNTLFYPGRLIYINPSHSLGGTGRPWIEGSVYQIMGLGGYHQIRTVKSQISDGVFTTQVEADFVASGFKVKNNKRKQRK